jgi:gliding motility-associated-like protein
VTDANGCSGGDSTVIASLYPVPVNFLPRDTSICSYERFTVTPANQYSSYRWSTGETTATIQVRNPGAFWLEVQNQQGCRGRDSIRVEFRDCLAGFFVPNAFTPNGDGLNDVFHPLLYGRVSSYTFAVYNRFGQRIFSSDRIGSGWDGTVKGALQPSGVFTWVCVYQWEGGETHRESGTVMLIR